MYLLVFHNYYYKCNLAVCIGNRHKEMPILSKNHHFNTDSAQPQRINTTVLVTNSWFFPCAKEDVLRKLMATQILGIREIILRNSQWLILVQRLVKSLFPNVFYPHSLALFHVSTCVSIESMYTMGMAAVLVNAMQRANKSFL